MKQGIKNIVTTRDNKNRTMKNDYRGKFLCRGLIYFMLVLLFLLCGCTTQTSPQDFPTENMPQTSVPSNNASDNTSGTTPGDTTINANQDNILSILPGSESVVDPPNQNSTTTPSDPEDVTDPNTSDGAQGPSDGAQGPSDDSSSDSVSQSSQNEENISSGEISSSDAGDSSTQNTDLIPEQGSAPDPDSKPDTTAQPENNATLCSYCGERGHTDASCPAKAADQAPCSYCGKPGHKITSCSQKANDEAPCSYCKKTGHKVESCPTKAADEAPCSYCSETGHKVADCEKKKADEFDIAYWVQYAKDYAVSIGLKLDSTMAKDRSCWDTPISAYSQRIYLERDIQSRMNYYKECIAYYGFAGYVWAWAEEVKPGVYDLYVFYA